MVIKIVAYQKYHLLNVYKKLWKITMFFAGKYDSLFLLHFSIALQKKGPEGKQCIGLSSTLFQIHGGYWLTEASLLLDVMLPNPLGPLPHSRRPPCQKGSI